MKSDLACGIGVLAVGVGVAGFFVGRATSRSDRTLEPREPRQHASQASGATPVVSYSPAGSWHIDAGATANRLSKEDVVKADLDPTLVTEADRRKAILDYLIATRLTLHIRRDGTGVAAQSDGPKPLDFRWEYDDATATVKMTISEIGSSAPLIKTCTIRDGVLEAPPSSSEFPFPMYFKPEKITNPK